MARRKRTFKLRPRKPSRAKRKATRSAPGHQHAELVGLALVALGLFIGAVLYLDWSGGFVGGRVADGLHALVGAAAYAVPPACLVVGGLMVARSSLVDVRPFRTGLVVLAFGVLLALGDAHGGHVGRALERLFGRLLGSTGATLLGVTAALVGVLLLTGASVGALLRRSGHAVRTVGGAARRRLERAPEPPAPAEQRSAARKPATPPVDGVHDFPDVLSSVEPAPLVPPPEDMPTGQLPEQESPFDARPETGDYRLPDRGLLRSSPPAAGPDPARIASRSSARSPARLLARRMSAR